MTDGVHVSVYLGVAFVLGYFVLVFWWVLIMLMSVKEHLRRGQFRHNDDLIVRLFRSLRSRGYRDVDLF